MRISDWSSDVCSSDLALYTVEEQLNEACGPLQEAGRRTIEGEELGSLLQFAVFNAMEICAAKSEEVAYYVRLARSYSSPAVAAQKTTVKTAWACCPRGLRGPVPDTALAQRTPRGYPPPHVCDLPHTHRRT